MNINYFLTPYGTKPKLYYFQYRSSENVYFCALDIAKKDGRLAVMLTQPACSAPSVLNYRKTIANNLYILLRQAKIIENPADIDWYNLFLSDTVEFSELRYFKVNLQWNGEEFEDADPPQHMTSHIEMDLMPFDLSDFSEARSRYPSVAG